MLQPARKLLPFSIFFQTRSSSVFLPRKVDFFEPATPTHTNSYIFFYLFFFFFNGVLFWSLRFIIIVTAILPLIVVPERGTLRLTLAID